MSIRKTYIALAALLFAGASFASSENHSIPEGATHEGDLETRNGSILVGADAIVDGDLESRNGGIETGSGVTAGNISSRNGSVVLGAGGRYGRIESRNGGVELGDASTAAEIETRNGGISIGAESSTGSIDSRNGGVSVGPRAVVEGSIETRNGGVGLDTGSRVSGSVITRNGDVTLSGATAAQGIRTLAGDVVLEDGSRSGSIVVEVTEDRVGHHSGFFGLGGGPDWPEAGDIRILEGSEVDGDVVLVLDADYDEAIPVVEIGSDARVRGNLRIDERVELIVAGTVDGEIERVSH